MSFPDRNPASAPVGRVRPRERPREAVAARPALPPPSSGEARLEGRACGRPGEAGLEAEDRLRMRLGDARLGDAEHLADLAQSQLLVVVERDDELLALGETRDRVGD